jgi:hypothetical protein
LADVSATHEREVRPDAPTMRTSVRWIERMQRSNPFARDSADTSAIGTLR